jgi:hypothetical protein
MLHQVGGVIPESAAGNLLDEVTNLVESPTVIRGAFDPAFLELPEWVLAAACVQAAAVWLHGRPAGHPHTPASGMPWP